MSVTKSAFDAGFCDKVSDPYCLNQSPAALPDSGVGLAVGNAVGNDVGAFVGNDVGAFVGADVNCKGDAAGVAYEDER